MLPQQSLSLRVAAEAVADAGWNDRPRLRAGVFIGIGLDLNTTNFHFRWSLLREAKEWDRQLSLGLSEDELARWTEHLRDAAGPPLTANRTMGALGGLVASRIGASSGSAGRASRSPARRRRGRARSTSRSGCSGRGSSTRRSSARSIWRATSAPCSRRIGSTRILGAGTVRPLAPEANGTVSADGAARWS